MSSRAKRLVLAAFLIGLGVVALIAVVRSIIEEVSPAADGDAGATNEALFARPDSVPLPVFADVTEAWGLDGWAMEGKTNMRGGVAAGDLNADGLMDLALAGGAPAAWINTGSGFTALALPDTVMGDATAVTIADVDGDGTNDLLIGYLDGPVRVVDSTGDWFFGDDAMTTGLVVADVTGDGSVDVVRSVYGGPDVVFVGLGDLDEPGDRDDRDVVELALPNSSGLSMVASVFDATGSGEPDIWVTRDIGWDAGPDSVYSFVPDASARGGGTFEDVGAAIGGAQAVDGMGITAADLSGDGVLDVYISDIGDNELLIGAGGTFGPAAGGASADRGLARIRPPGSGDDIVSSSWSSGATDINHDGIVDLIVVNGGFAFGEIRNKIQGTAIEMADPPAVLLGLGDGTYTDGWAQSWSTRGEDAPLLIASRGMALADLDGDSDADIVISNFSGGLTILRNDTPGPVTRIVGEGCVGAHVEVTGGAGPVVSVLGAQGFLGHHGPELSVGANSTLTVRVNRGEPRSAEPGSTLDVADQCAPT